MVSDVTLRPARPDEAEVLTELVLRSKAHWGYSEEFMESCREELTIHAHTMVASRMTVAEAEGRVVAVATLEGEPPRAELGSLFVDPGMIGKGTSGHLVDPWPEALAIAKVGQPALNPKVNFLEHVADVRGICHPTSHEGPEMPFDFLPGGARRGLDQDVGLLSSRSTRARSRRSSAVSRPRL